MWLFFYDAVVETFDKTKKPITLSACNWDQAGLFLGVCTYSYESIGTLYNGKGFLAGLLTF